MKQATKRDEDGKMHVGDKTLPSSGCERLRGATATRVYICGPKFDIRAMLH